MTVHGIAMMLFALIASVGALIDHYQIEYAAIWFNIAAVMGTAGWAYTWASSNDGTFASLIMPLSLIYIALNLFRRWNYLSTIADTNRTLYAVRKV